MTHFQRTQLHTGMMHSVSTGLFADLSKETIGFQVHIPDSDGTCCDLELDSTSSFDVEETSSEVDWDALREAEADEAWMNLKDMCC